MKSITLDRIGPGAGVQAIPRLGYMHEGVPSGGPLVPALFSATNRSLGNSPHDALIEAPLASVVLRAEQSILVSVNGCLCHLRAGEGVTVTGSDEAVSYIGVPGGFDVPEVLGSRSTLAVAGLGGHRGRTLRARDVLTARLAEPLCEPRNEVLPPPDPAAAIRVIRGPDAFPAAALNALFATTFKLSALSNRTGQRLEGATLPVACDDRPGSLPMVRGAIQVTLDGSLIVLGPDHPTTGGYPVVAVVITTDQGELARRRPGAEVRFSAA